MQGHRPLVLASALPLLLLLVAACASSEGAEIELVPRDTAIATGPVSATASGTASPTPEPTPPAPGNGSARAASAASAATPATVALTATPNAEGVFIVVCGDPLVPLNKRHLLEAGCTPPDLQPVPEAFAYGPQSVVAAALPSLIQMLEAAAAEGHRLVVVSSYRSYESQHNAFQYHVNEYGPEQAERVSARPGHSEHQLGTTVDLSSASVGYELVQAFGSTPEGRWLAEYAHEFGFVISYPEGFEQVTGYDYEPWHLRWVGRALAAAVRASGLTLIEFLLP